MLGALGSTHIFATAARALASGHERMADAGARFATELDATAIVDVKLGEMQARSAAAIVRTADEMLGTLIDELA